MIKQIVVHPKGATHFQVLVTKTYFLKMDGGVWQFWGDLIDKWVNDSQLNGYPLCNNYLQKLGEIPRSAFYV